MLLDTFNEDQLLFNTNVLAKTSDGDQMAFRGDLVLEEGEYHELSGKKLAAKAVLYQAVMLTDDSKIKLMSGCLRELELLPLFVKKYGEYLAEECTPVFYVMNIRKECVVELEGKKYLLLGADKAMVWNDLMELYYLEKADFKGQSSGDKMITMYDGAKDLKVSKYETVLFHDLKGETVELEEGYGPV
ncbi:hypothetical protein [Magnetofaba australis]|nr:hypothetical protein [Magnetofaba australis]